MSQKSKNDLIPRHFERWFLLQCERESIIELVETRIDLDALCALLEKATKRQRFA